MGTNTDTAHTSSKMALQPRGILLFKLSSRPSDVLPARRNAALPSCTCKSGRTRPPLSPLLQHVDNVTSPLGTVSLVARTGAAFPSLQLQGGSGSWIDRFSETIRVACWIIRYLMNSAFPLGGRLAASEHPCGLAQCFLTHALSRQL